MTDEQAAAIDRYLTDFLTSLHHHCAGDTDRALWMLQTAAREQRV